MNGYRFRAQRPNNTDEENPYLPIMQKGGFLDMRRFNESGLKGRTRGRQSSIDLNDNGLSMHGNAKIKYYGNPVRRSSQGSMSYQPMTTTSKPVDTPISERGYSTDNDESFWKSEEGQKLMQSWNIPVIQQPAQNPVTSTQQNQTTNPYLQKPYIISDITNFGNSIKDSNGNITLGSRRYNPYSQVIKPVSARETSPVISGNGQTPVNYDIVANNGDSFTIDDPARPISFINPTLQSSGPVLTSSSAFNPYLQSTGYAAMGNLNDYMAQRSGMNITPFVNTQQNLPPILTKNRPITDNRPVVSTIPQSKCGGEKAQAGDNEVKYLNDIDDFSRNGHLSYAKGSLSASQPVRLVNDQQIKNTFGNASIRPIDYSSDIRRLTYNSYANRPVMQEGKQVNNNESRSTLDWQKAAIDTLSKYPGFFQDLDKTPMYYYTYNDKSPSSFNDVIEMNKKQAQELALLPNDLRRIHKEFHPSYTYDKAKYEKNINALKSIYPYKNANEYDQYVNGKLIYKSPYTQDFLDRVYEYIEGKRPGLTHPDYKYYYPEAKYYEDILMY